MHRRYFKNEIYQKTLSELLNEVKSVAVAKNISIPKDIVEITLEKMRKLPFETTSSMHSDFRKGGKTEYQSLTEYVTILGNQFNIPTPHFDNITKNFIERTKA